LTIPLKGFIWCPAVFANFMTGKYGLDLGSWSTTSWAKQMTIFGKKKPIEYIFFIDHWPRNIIRIDILILFLSCWYVQSWEKWWGIPQAFWILLCVLGIFQLNTHKIQHVNWHDNWEMLKQYKYCEIIEWFLLKFGWKSKFWMLTVKVFLENHWVFRKRSCAACRFSQLWICYRISQLAFVCIFLPKLDKQSNGEIKHNRLYYWPLFNILGVNFYNKKYLASNYYNLHILCHIQIICKSVGF
jgi:hypothetical protein